MTKAELFALTLADFNFNTNTISITKTVHHTEAGYQTAPPKTENGKRTISMPATIMEDVKTYCDKLYGLNPNDKLFNFSSQLIKRAMFSAAATADLPPIRIHDLRHSHVSLLIEMGFTPHLIADRIGDTVQMINNTYGHLYPNKQKEVAAVLDSLLVSK